MSITAIEIENFKGFKTPAKIDLKPVTMFFGPNSSGKSTVLHAIHYLREIFLHGRIDVHRPEFAGDSIDLGGFRKFVHNGEFLDKSVRICAHLDLRNEEFDNFGLVERDQCILSDNVESASVEVTVRWDPLKKSPFVSNYRIGINGEDLLTLAANQDKPEFEISSFRTEHPALNKIFGGAIELLDKDGTLRQQELLRNLDACEASLESHMESVPDAEPTRQQCLRLRKKVKDLENQIQSLGKDEKYAYAEFCEARDQAKSELEEYEKTLQETIPRTLEMISQLESKARVLRERIKEDDINLSQTDAGFSQMIEQSFLDEDLLDGIFPGSGGALPLWGQALELLPGNNVPGDNYNDLKRSEHFDEKDDDLLEEARWKENEAIRIITGVLSQLILGPGEALRKRLLGLRYIGPLRKVPQRNYQPAPGTERHIWHDGMAAWELLHQRGPAFAEQVGSWLGKDHLKSGYSCKIEDLRIIDKENTIQILRNNAPENVEDFYQHLESKNRLVLIDENNNHRHLEPIEVGVGLSQILPIIVGGLDHETGILAVEQPELHLHPAIQVELGDFFATRIQEENNLQFLIETHSEHLILRLCRRIRETTERERKAREAGAEKPSLDFESSESNEDRPDPGGDNPLSLSPEDVCIACFEQGDNGSSFYRIRIDEDGEFRDPWPKGFFPERLEEL